MTRTKKPSWQQLILIFLLLSSACLHFWALEKEGYSNPYYSAAVQSMLENPSAFFFASFDSGLYVTVDKPALGLWLQALSARVFGVNSFGLLLPSALAGTLSVLVLFLLVRKKWGATAGVIAAGILAFTPILVALSRTNNLDVLLVFFLLCGALLIQKAAEKQSLPLFMAAMAMVGLGFNIKMLQAFLVVPAFLLLYWLGTGKLLKKLLHTLAAVVVLAVVSFSWALAVDLTPASARPYVGGSETNSVIELALGYNGVSRLLGNQSKDRGDAQPPGAKRQEAPDRPAQSGDEPGARQPRAPRVQPPRPQNQTRAAGAGAGGTNENGETGALRLLNEQLAGLSSWFLLPALGTILAGAALWLNRRKSRDWTAEKKQRFAQIMFWGAWLLPMAVFFSVAAFIHRYYVVMLAPATAALSAIAITAAWNSRHQRWLVPVAILSATAAQCVIIARSSWRWLALAVLAFGLLGTLVYLMQKKRVAAVLFALALLIAPVAWSLTPVFGTLNAHIPDAGPDADIAAGSAREGIATSASTDYIVSHYGGERWALAVSSANAAAPIILETGLPVMAIGGFSGGDTILTLDALKAYVATGALRYVLLTEDQAQNEIFRWIQKNATPVLQEARATLFDLSGALE